MGAKSPSATIRNRGGAMSGWDGLRCDGGFRLGRHGAARLYFTEGIAVDLAHEDVPNQHHDEGEDRDRHDEAGETEQLTDEKHTGDGDHRRQVDLSLHDHGRYKVGL